MQRGRKDRGRRRHVTLMSQCRVYKSVTINLPTSCKAQPHSSASSSRSLRWTWPPDVSDGTGDPKVGGLDSHLSTGHRILGSSVPPKSIVDVTRVGAHISHISLSLSRPGRDRGHRHAKGPQTGGCLACERVELSDAQPWSVGIGGWNIRSSGHGMWKSDVTECGTWKKVSCEVSEP